MSDKYGNNCSIWYNQLNLPTQLESVSFHDSCCFMFNINSYKQYICLNKRNHCQQKTKIIMKTLKKGN